MKKYSLLAALAFSALTVTATPKESTSQGTPQDMDKFITELMGKMTLHEKIGQLNLPVTGNIVTGQAKSSDVASKIRNGEVGGLFNLKGVKNIREVQKLAVENSRLGIPLLFGMDVIHGYETVFPIPLALSCSWDMEAIEKSARIAAIESSADGICWTFSPMVDICRDARWGRVSEGNGEDPFLGSAIAQAMIRGYQGKDMSANNEIMACVKHFALYGAGEAGRDYNTVDMSRNRMFNEYFPPYKAAIEAGVGSAMTSFNEIDGVPATANHWLLTDVLRNQWGFDGFVVTDYTAISEMIDHGIGDLQEVSARALTAGTDMDMVADGFIGTLEKSLKEGKVTEADIDKACRRILEAKYKLGLFANPYKYCDVKRAEKEVFTPEHRSIARQIATETFVLLKNQDNLLPLQRKGNIALIGPLANTRANMPGTWSVAATADKYSTLLEGFKNSVGSKANILYAQGSNLMYDADGSFRLFRAIYDAMGQAFFTLSLGIGAMAIFGSYIGKERRLFGEAINVGVLDTCVAFVSGLIIFPSAFAFGVNPGQGPSLIFVTLPNVFNAMPGGQLWGALFFVFLFFAALSTVTAVFENILACWMDRFGISRGRAVLANLVLIFLLSLPCLLGNNLWSGVKALGMGIMDWEDFLVSNNLLPIGSMIYLLFCCVSKKYGWGYDHFLEEANQGRGVRFPAQFRLYFKYVLPVIVLIIFIMGYWDKFKPFIVAALGA